MAVGARSLVTFAPRTISRIRICPAGVGLVRKFLLPQIQWWSVAPISTICRQNRRGISTGSLLGSMDTYSPKSTFDSLTGSRCYSNRTGLDLSDEGLFSNVVDSELEHFGEQLDDILSEVEDSDVEESHGVLNISIGDKTWVLSKQTPNRQIWWSSPLSGPIRFDYEPASGNWISGRTGHVLNTLLSEEMSTVLNETVVVEMSSH